MSLLWKASESVKQKSEAISTTAQDQALQTNWIMANIENTELALLRRVCHVADKSAMHIASRL